MTFDDGYTNRHAVRLFFGHPSGGHEGAPFASKDVVITDATGDTIDGYQANARDKTSGSLSDQANGKKPTVRVRDERIAVRKSAVIMKRDFGEVSTDVPVTEDDSGRFDPDDEPADEEPGRGEGEARGRDE